MKDLENNKIFAALLVAVIAARGGYILAEHIVSPVMVMAPGAVAAADAGGTA